MSNILKRVIGKSDDFIDDDIDRILGRMKTDTQEQFKARWDNLPDYAKSTIKRLVQEQMKVEVKHKRLDELETLAARLESFE